MSSAVVECMVCNCRVKQDEIDSDTIPSFVIWFWAQTKKYSQPVTRYNLSNINIEELTRQTDAFLDALERHLWETTNEHIDFYVEAHTTALQRVMDAVLTWKRNFMGKPQW